MSKIVVDQVLTNVVQGYKTHHATQSLDLEIFLDGKDRISGKNGSLTIPHAKLSADGEINWFSDDWWESGLTGTVVKEEGKSAMTFKEFG